MRSCSSSDAGFFLHRLLFVEAGDMCRHVYNAETWLGLECYPVLTWWYNRTVSGVWDMASNWLASTFCDGWSKYKLGLPSAPLHYGPLWPVGISTIFRPQWQSLCTAPMAGRCLPLGLCKGDCERVYGLTAVNTKSWLLHSPRLVVLGLGGVKHSLQLTGITPLWLASLI